MPQKSQVAQALTAPAPREHCVEEWLDLMHTCHVLLLAGMRGRIGPDADLQEEYRRWYQAQMQEHDELLGQTCQRLHDASLRRDDAA